MPASRTRIIPEVDFAKDRVLGHNPAAALLLADTYYRHLYGPLKPATRRRGKKQPAP